MESIKRKKNPTSPKLINLGKKKKRKTKKGDLLMYTLFYIIQFYR